MSQPDFEPATLEPPPTAAEVIAWANTLPRDVLITLMRDL